MAPSEPKAKDKEPDAENDHEYVKHFAEDNPKLVVLKWILLHNDGVKHKTFNGKVKPKLQSEFISIRTCKLHV